MPEEVIVLQTACPVDDFIAIVRRVDGLEWLGELEDDDIPPDDDFFVLDKAGVRRDGKTLRGRVFLVLTNQTALTQLLRLWDLWKVGGKLPRGLAKLGDVFHALIDVRPWGIQDRLAETGVLDDWEERLEAAEHDEDRVPCEIELWFRTDERQRGRAAARVQALIEAEGGVVGHQLVLAEIGYHALQATFAITTIRRFMDR